MDCANTLDQHVVGLFGDFASTLDKYLVGRFGGFENFTVLFSRSVWRCC